MITRLFKSTAVTLLMSASTAALAQTAATGGDTATTAATQTAAEHAASATDGGIPDIVVTAQKRAQSIQDVPVSITAFTGQSLTRLGITQSDQLTKFTPNLTWNPTGAVGSSVGIRGVTDTSFTTNQVGSVGIVVDEVSLNSPVLNTIPVFDLERVEVLRGPQVALYGRSTTGGAINFITRRAQPGGDFTGFLDASYGNYNAVSLEGGVSIPLGQTLGLRVAGLGQWRDGIYFDPTQNRKVSDRDRQALRASLTGKFGDLDLYANVQYGRDRGGGPYYKSVGTRNPDGSVCTPTSSFPGGPCVNGGGFRDTASFKEVYGDAPSFQNIDILGGQLNLDYHLNGVVISSITSHIWNKIRLYGDLDGSPVSLAEIHLDNSTKQTAQELRLASDKGPAARLNWILGGYFFDERQNGLIAQAGRVLQNAPPPGPILRALRYSQRNRIWSAYGQVDFKITPELELTLGGRYSDETKGGQASTLRARGPAWVPNAPPVGFFFDRNTILQYINPADSNSTPVPFDKSWHNGGGKIGLNWKPNRDTLVYASVSRGFKGGTFNFVPGQDLTGLIAPLGAANFQAGVRPEKLTTYEVGTKLSLFDRMVEFNAALFRNEYKDQQQIVFKDGGPVLVNAASSHTNGAEFELNFAPGGGFTLQSGLSLLDGKYDKYIDPSGFDYSGGKIVQASDVTANATARQAFEIGSGELSIQGTIKYFSSYYATVPYVALDKIPGQTLIDVRVGYAFGANRNFDLSAFGQNLTNRRYCATTGEIPWGLGQCAPNEPRTYGVRFRASF